MLSGRKLFFDAYTFNFYTLLCLTFCLHTLVGLAQISLDQFNNSRNVNSRSIKLSLTKPTPLSKSARLLTYAQFSLVCSLLHAILQTKILSKMIVQQRIKFNIKQSSMYYFTVANSFVRCLKILLNSSFGP